MWSWLLGNNSNSASGGSGRGARFGSFLQPAAPRREFTLANMQHLHHQLLRYSELPDAEIVELLRVLSEFLIYSDQNRASSMGSPPSGVGGEFAAPSAAGAFFDYFCEKNILALLLTLGQSAPRVPVQIQLLQTLSILVQNIATRTSLYYLLSNNYVNKLLECDWAYDRDDDVRDWFVTLLKALSLRLNEDTVQFFFDAESGSFPLYAQALRFGRCSETMVKVAVKTLMLNVLKVQDDRVRRFLLEYQKMAYFADVVEYANEMALKIQGLLNIWTPTASAVNDKLDEAVDAYIDHCYYLQDILDVNLPELCYKVGDLLFTRHIKHFLAVSLLPNCNPPPQRISTRLALYLLTRLLGILEHTPLVNAISFLLLSPDAHERSEYSTVALGAGGLAARKKSTRRTNASTATAATAVPTPTTASENTAQNDSAGAVAAPSSSSRATAKSTRKKTGAKKSSRRRIVFRTHASGECNSPVCYLQTRYSHGEWPLDEVRAFELKESNWFRQSLLTLIDSSDEVLASTALLVVISVINNSSIDHSLQREMDILPYRLRKHHHHHHKSSAAKDTSGSAIDTVPEGEDDDALEDSASSSSASSSHAETEESPSDGTVEVADDGSSASHHPDLVHSPPGSAVSSSQPSQWLIERVLRLMNRSPDVRILSTQLCARLLLDLVCEHSPTSAAPSSMPARDDHHLLLTPDQLNALVAVHSVCTHQVMQSMRGAMADVDLFVYVLEDEFSDFQKAPFPLVLQLKTSSPYEFLVPLVSPSSDAGGENKATLHLRHPSNEMEACRKAMRTFLILRRLRAMVDPDYVDDGLDELTACRHPHTATLASVTPSRHTTSVRDAVDLGGMVFLKCVWREQRFFATPARLLMVLNPEAVVLVERQVDDGNKDGSSPSADAGDRGFVRLYAPVHRVYASLDVKDELVLHLTISSAVPVEGCRSYRKSPPKDNAGRGALRNWHVSVLFETAEDARQAKANVDLCRAEVRAFKLLKIEEALSAHVQITSSHVTSRDSVASTIEDQDQGQAGSDSAVQADSSNK